MSAIFDTAFDVMYLVPMMLSFGFYIPVVLFADAVPLIGMLMIPKPVPMAGLY